MVTKKTQEKKIWLKKKTTKNTNHNKAINSILEN